MCVLAALVLASPAYSAAPRQMATEGESVQTAPAHAHAMADQTVAVKMPCLAGHCPDANGMSIMPDCAAGSGHCGPALAAILPDVPSFWPPSAGVPTVVHAHGRVAQRASDPPPPRAGLRTV